MDPQTRNFRDFLQLYNKITEMCFSNCVDNFFSREVSKDETSCVEKCLHKFTRVNQRIMGVYVDVQTEINQRRIAEMESLQQANSKVITPTPEILTTEPIFTENNETFSEVTASSQPSKIESAR